MAHADDFGPDATDPRITMRNAPPITEIDRSGVTCGQCRDVTGIHSWIEEAGRGAGADRRKAGPSDGPQRQAHSARERAHQLRTTVPSLSPDATRSCAAAASSSPPPGTTAWVNAPASSQPATCAAPRRRIASSSR